MGPHPRMVGRGVVRHEIEQKLDASSCQAFAELRQCRFAAQRLAYIVARDRKPRAADVVLGQVGQNRLELGVALRVAARDGAAGGAGLPDAQQPNPVETLLCKAVKRGVVDVCQGDPLPGFARQTLKPNAGVDLKKGRIARRGRHGQTPYAVSIPRPKTAPRPPCRKVSASSLPKMSIRPATTPVQPV